MLDVCWTFAESCKHPIIHKSAAKCYASVYTLNLIALLLFSSEILV